MKFKTLVSILLVVGVGISVQAFIPKINKDETVSIPVAKQFVEVRVQKAQGEVKSQNNTTQVAIHSQDENANWIEQEINAIQPQATNLSKEVLKVSLVAYQHAEQKGVTHSPLLTIVDYSKPSYERRLWVVDLEKKKVLFNTWVAHGRNSGNVTASSFSNTPESLKSSLGVFVTDEVYSGKHGNSLRVQGLESGINNNAYDRSIVFHGATYVSGAIASSGRIGRSWGCWAVSPDIIPSLIKTIKNKVLVVAYYPDQKWLNNSTFLN